MEALVARRVAVSMDLAPEQEQAVAEAVRDALERWPELDVEAAEFAEVLVQHWPEEVARKGALGPLCVADLLLAHACRRGDPKAIAAFERAYGGEMEQTLASLRSRGIDPADARQQLIQRFFVGTAERPPRIDSYSGRGTLRAWVKVASVRLRIDLDRKRSDKDGPLDTAQRRLLAAADDPELDFMKRHYREAFKVAFADALAGLDARQRNVLRLSVCAGLSATKIAELYKVHRATAKRWLADAREELFTATKAALARRLAIDPAEFDSIVRLIDTHFDVSVARLLG